MTRTPNGFFWGGPTHKSIAWVGAVAGLLVVALAGIVALHGQPFFVLSILLVGLAEFGWAAELLPRRAVRLAGWARVARWLCALLGTLLALTSLALNLTTVVWFALVILGTGLLLAWEMAPAPYSPANRP
jgi:hypothetical protein